MSDELDNPAEDTGEDWASAMQEQADTEGETGIAPADGGSNYEAAEFQNLQDEGGGVPSDLNLDVILDVPVSLSMEIGRTHINIRNLLQLGRQ